jgi:hypothetical protein
MINKISKQGIRTNDSNEVQLPCFPHFDRLGDMLDPKISKAVSTASSCTFLVGVEGEK